MRYLIFILLILTNSYSYAQIDMSNFCNFNEYDGLSNASIIDITQDNKGLIWFGTRNGLNKFDGYTFYNYLENKNIQDLMIDGNNLWIALKPYMLCHFNLITEKINYYKPTNYEKGAITSILKHNDSLL